MSFSHFFQKAGFLIAMLPIYCFGANPSSGAPEIQAVANSSNISLKKEVQHAIDKGLSWLKMQQNPAGFWSSPDYPAVTALVLTSYMGEPSGKIQAEEPEFIQKGYSYLLKCVQPDGGIYKKDLWNYNTSISMMALLATKQAKYDPVLRNARKFVIGQQADFKKRGEKDRLFDGGIGYGDDDGDHSDLSNTLYGLEALYYSQHLKKGKELEEAKDLNWAAAIAFVERCQNLPSHNKEPYASADPQNKGGFIYAPNQSQAGAMPLPSGKTALRSYGSMSYAGLLSYIYADLKRDDPRVVAVFDWLQQNYSLEENPGLQNQGLYYYYHTMTKALSTYGVDRLTLKNGQNVIWREDLAKRLLNLQKNDGFWVNETGRWWEKDPVLVTSYTLIALEILHRGL